MGVWIEIQCDKQLPGADPRDTLQSLCYSFRGDGPGLLTESTIAGMRLGYRVLGERALAGGWVRRGGEWACPGCKE